MYLQALTKVCSNPQTLVDLFLNYDCDVNGDDLFESMVNVISHVTRTIRPTDNGDAATVAEVCPMRLFQCADSALGSPGTNHRFLVRDHERRC